MKSSHETAGGGRDDGSTGSSRGHTRERMHPQAEHCRRMPDAPVLPALLLLLHACCRGASQAVNGGSPTWFGITIPFDLNTLLGIVSDC